MTYNLETGTYDAESLLLEQQGENWFKFNDVSVSFEDGKLVSVKFVYALNSWRYVETAYTYSEIGTASTQLPETWHKHTYSEEWAVSKYTHWHASTCGHNYAMKDEKLHTFNEVGVCTVCGYSFLELSEDGKTVIKFTGTENIRSVTIPEGVTTIGEEAFRNCWYLTNVVFPNSLTSIGDSAFEDCDNLTELVLPVGLSEVGERAFAGCSQLKTVTLPSTLTKIGYFMFYNCAELTTVNILEGITEIGYMPFNYCESLTEIVVPKSVTALDRSAFSGSSITKIYYNGSKEEWGKIPESDKLYLRGISVYFYSATDPDEAGKFWHYDNENKIALWQEHTFAEEWSYNDDNHWHASNCTHEHASEKKSGLEKHDFTTEETENGTKYTCSVCGYSDVRKSIYMVAEEEFANILSEVKKFKLVVTGEGGYTLILGDVSYVDKDYAEYYLKEGDVYFAVWKDDTDLWIKTETTKSIYDDRLSERGIINILSKYFSKFLYDFETKTYIADCIDLTDSSGLVTSYYDVTASFENKALKSLTYNYYCGYGSNSVKLNCEYTDIGTANAELPAIHEHTFAEEWSYDDQNHWHVSKCVHEYEIGGRGEHTFEKGVCTVCGYNVLNISDDGKTLYGIQYGFDEDYDFNTFIIPKSVITISSGAFDNYTKLTGLDIPEGVTTIEEYAFYGCTGLTRISLPNTLTSIGENVFAGCTALKEIILPNNVTEFDLSAFADCSISIYYKGSKSDWEKMTEGADVMGEVTLNFYSETDPADIGNFWYYDENGKITLWGAHTFEEEWTYDETNHWRVATCEHTDIKGMFGPHTFDDGVVDGDRMKLTCTACGYLKTEESPYLVTEEEFKNILNSVNIFKVKVTGEERFTAILNDVRYYESEDSMIYYTFENGEYYAISKDGDQWVKDETAKESYDLISNYNLFAVFSESFSEFTVDLKTMSYNAYCIEITDEDGYTVFYYGVSVSFENNAVTSLAFNISNYGLNFEYSEIGTASKDLPTDIHEHTFNEEWWWDDSKHCHYATCEHGTATKDSGFHTFEKGVCTECGFNVLIVSKDGTTVTGITDAYDEEGYRLEYNGFTIPEGVTTIGKKLFYENYDITEIVIPEGVTAIEEYAFAYCSNLTRVTLPSTLKTMASHAFAWCRKLNGVILPSDLTSMELNCFDGCTALTEITIPSGITIINDNMFFECTSLKTVNLPDTVTTLGFQAFYGCTALTEMVIPNSVTEFEQAAFWKSAISKIYYGGTKAEYDKISGLNYISDSVTVYFYSETEPTEEGNFWHYVDGMPVQW